MADAYSKHLQHLGYSAIALPSSAFRPLALVWERGGKRGWSDDFDYLVQQPALGKPPVAPPVAFPTLAGKTVRNLSVTPTISVLSGLISALGGGTLKLSGGFEHASTITFEYEEVTMTQVSEAALDAFLRSGTPPPRDTLLHSYLSDHLFVATRVLSAKRFTVSADTSDGRSIELEVPVISNAVGAGVKVEKKTETGTKITFTGDQPAAFAFQAFQVTLESAGGGLNRLVLKPAKAGSVSTHYKAVVDGLPDDAGATEVEGFEATVLTAADGVPVLDTTSPQALPEAADATA